MIKLLIDAHVFDGKYQGTRTYIQGIYSAMITHKDIEFYFAAQNVSRLKSIFGIAENIHYIRLDASPEPKYIIAVRREPTRGSSLEPNRYRATILLIKCGKLACRNI